MIKPEAQETGVVVVVVVVVVVIVVVDVVGAAVVEIGVGQIS